MVPSFLKIPHKLLVIGTIVKVNLLQRSPCFFPLPYPCNVT
jgi:hypothetical protein